jgi:hypothetical protein
MKNIMETTKSSPRQVCNIALRGANYETVGSVGQIETIHRTLRRFRTKLINPEPFMFPELKLSRLLAYTHIDTLFYRYGPDNYNSSEIHDSIVIFFF